MTEPTEPTQESKKFYFERSINMGHIISFVLLIGMMAGMYNSIDKRLAVVEASALFAATVAVEQQNERKESIREIKIDIKDIQRSLNQIGQAVAAGKK